MTLEQLQQRCYTPYSSQPQWAVVRSRAGFLYPGVRIENSSFPLTISAVQCGLTICLSEGEQPETLFLPDSQHSPTSVDYWTTELDLKISKFAKMDGEPAKLLHITQSINGLLSELLEHARTPYSGFSVSALLETEDGVVTGVNLEFSDWQTGLCAERVAIAKARAADVDMHHVKALHLHSRSGEYCSPCGACRQVIVEHLPRTSVMIHHPDGSLSRYFSSDLLPYSFKSDFLKENTQQK